MCVTCNYWDCVP